ncbi:ubiquitin-like protein Pup [Flaviflexus salsibiostraticola]|uniref:Prokaryotic ubiquitin-like protein Pup n=1 Tax=Flaviflexus salsibiostraticola TaxID=1282737 RepID=A0A3S8Z6N1_9ACTO|nr:ubiquitin-like protein Pup [Flaviflexus salsibiostraticola]AZN29161.1 ubiquitin-like protein Pup [Flaviflexus salsibiostraticola]
MQERIQKQSQRKVDAPQETIAKQTQHGGIDSLLDEIDTVLESNAEAFVQGFVQKGGE